MKLNPFKKSSPYYDKIKTDHKKLNDELAGFRSELGAAKSDYDRENSIYKKMCDESSNTSEKKSRQNQIVSEAYNRVGDSESRISQINALISPLSMIVEAPEQYLASKKTLKDLLARQTSLNINLVERDELLDTVGKRIATLETLIASETKAAAQSPINKEGEFAVPESLAKIDIELRLGRATQVELQSKRELLIVELRELSNAIIEATRLFIFWRDVITESELHDQLLPIMGLFARAMVTRYERDNGHSDERRYAVEIPHELIESAAAELASEIPTA